MQSYRLTIKIGSNEFHGEGPEESVRRDFAEWKHLILDLARGEVPANRELETPRKLSSRAAGVFDSNGRTTVTLRILPRQAEERESEAILLILYGSWLANGCTEVPVTDLKQALKQSGIRVDRIDRAAGRIVADGLLNKGGVGKGGRYALTAHGKEAAARLLDRLAPGPAENESDN